MILNDADLKRLCKGATPLVEYGSPSEFDKAVQPCSLEVTLSDDYLDPSTGQSYVSKDMGLEPGGFLLASTREWVNVPSNLMGQVHGKSTWGRKGLQVHVTAGLIDPGFIGTITLELANVGKETLRLTYGVSIAQLTFETMTAPAAIPYGDPRVGSHYQGQRGVTAPWH